MPIKRLQNDRSQFPCIGQLRKGDEKPDKGIGKDLEHFRFTTEDEQAAKMFAAAYGPTPDTIDVFLPYETTGENFSAWQEEWAAGGLRHRCDGETCVMWLDEKTGQYRTDPIPCPGGCKEVGRLMVIIPELQRFAYVTALTSSVWDIITLTENLQAVEAMAGKLTGIPFILKRRPKEISTPSGANGKRARRVKWLLSIEVDPAWAATRFVAMQRAAIGVSPVDETHMLEAFDDDDADELDAIDVASSEPEPIPEPANGDDNPFEDEPTSREQEILDEWDGMSFSDIKQWLVDNGLATDLGHADEIYKAAKDAVGVNKIVDKKMALKVRRAILRNLQMTDAQPA